MNKLALIGSAAALMALPALAQAQASRGSTLTFNLDADVGTICGVYDNNQQSVDVPFGDLATKTSTQDVTVSTTLTYRCNAPGGFNRKITSANDGKLVRVGTTGGSMNEIAYRFGHGAGPLGANLGVGLRSGIMRPAPFVAVDTTHTQNSAGNFVTGVQAEAVFEVGGVFRTYGGYANGAPGTSVYAGDYKDTVTITINAL